MAELEFRSDVTVELVSAHGSDDDIIQAMLVSTQAEDALDATATSGRIDFLMKNRHGTPFEHAFMKFYIEAPIFVFREFHRHRIGWSYNEVSGRYRELDPIFYTPGHQRNLVQEGKPGHYQFVPGDSYQYGSTISSIEFANRMAYAEYERMLANGIAKEVARMCLPVNIFSAMFATANPRSIMAFLSLRTKREDSTFPSFPQREIEMVADKIETYFSAQFPLTWEAFNKFGRVSP